MGRGVRRLSLNTVFYLSEDRRAADSDMKGVKKMKVTITMANTSGLHARPAVLIAERASKFQADVRLHANGKTAKATDVLQIMGLGITCGTEAVYTLAGMMAAKEIYQ